MKYILKGDIVYYIGEISINEDKSLLIELWSPLAFSSLPKAQKAIKELNDKGINLQIIDDKKYDVAKSQRWE
jgi:hypothetical protein